MSEPQSYMIKAIYPCQKKHIQQARNHIYQTYLNDRNIQQTIHSWSNYIIDLILTISKEIYHQEMTNCAIVALGSLGRSELLPFSDLDLLILHKNECNALTQKTERFIRSLWDLGFSVGSQVGSCQDIANLAKESLSTISALQDIKFITGNEALFETLCYFTHPSQMWQAHTFLEEKIKEQKKRHQKYNDKAYLLEPNIKESPGGLRDLQIIHLISSRMQHHNPGLMEKFDENELDTIKNYQINLLEIRFVLQMIANRREDRLLFEHQKKLAENFKYIDSEKGLAIEKFMKRYFTLMKRISALNEVILQFFSENMSKASSDTIVRFDSDFILINNYLSAKDSFIFKKNPSLLLKLFIILQDNPTIKGIHSKTISLIQKNKRLINQQFRQNPKNIKCFLSLLKKENRIFPFLKKMHRYGLLSRYLPEFSGIVGQMQFDLFHVYTVDIHSLFVVKNIDDYQQESISSPLSHLIFKSLDKPYLLYIAALFHDLGKGKGGCHSTIGKSLVIQFAKRHRLSQEDIALVAWLVRHHLLLSMTAQRKDLQDMQTIIDFCQEVKSCRTLNYLYLLTIADIKATNSNLWNNWKETLLNTLYHKAKNYLTHQVEYDEPDVVIKKQQEALNLLNEFSKEEITKLWQSIKQSYFLYQTPKMIGAHSKAILQSAESPVIVFFQDEKEETFSLMVYANYNEKRFYITVTLISNLGLNIAKARILKLKNEYCLDCYTIFKNRETLNQTLKQQKKLSATLKKHLSPPATLPKVVKRFLTRRQKTFKSAPNIQFEAIKNKAQTLMIISATEGFGILASIAEVFLNLSINVHHAKISTSGDRVEDSFYISNCDHKPLTAEEKKNLRQALTKALSKV